MIALYADMHVPRPVLDAVRARGVDVLTARDDGRATEADDRLLLRATELGRVMVSQDEDMLTHASDFIRRSTDFAGLICAHQWGITYAQFIDDLELICIAEERGYMKNRIEWLPLK